MNFQICRLTVRINGQNNIFGCGVSIVETFGDAVKNVETFGGRTELTHFFLSLMGLFTILSSPTNLYETVY